MFLFKLFFRSLWEIVSLPFAAAAPVVLLLLSPFLFIIGLFMLLLFALNPPSVLDSFLIGFGGARLAQNATFKARCKNFGRVLLRFLLQAVIWVVGYFIAAFLISLSTPQGLVVGFGGMIGAALFRRYVAPWIIAFFRSTPALFRRLQAAF